MNAVGSRRAAWRIISSVEQKEKSKGNAENADFAKEYRTKVEAELDDICGKILTLLDKNLIAKATSGESKVFSQKRLARWHARLSNRLSQSLTTLLKILTR